MLMIVMFHITVHCITPQLTSPYKGELIDPSLFHNPEFYKRLLVIETIIPFGKTGNAIFMIISGYFMGGYLM